MEEIEGQHNTRANLCRASIDLSIRRKKERKNFTTSQGWLILHVEEGIFGLYHIPAPGDEFSYAYIRARLPPLWPPPGIKPASSR
eukprot:scaffold190363_cov21-Prasinocladus_malaysianus.AAC.1